MITRWSDGIADANMAEDILVDLGGLIAVHPWWEARAELTLALLRRLGIRPPMRVLDVGCGWGRTLESLEQRGYRAVGLDISRRALEMLERPGRELVEADLSRPLPEGVETFDAVLALDVLEHLDDDRAAVERLGDLVRPGGAVVVSVPALPEFFTEFDEVQGHRRRYLPERLKGAFDQTGLVVERVFWWGWWLVPALKRQRAARRGRPGESPSEVYRRYLQLPAWPITWAARLAFALEQTPALWGCLPRGTSLFAVARRPTGSGAMPHHQPASEPASR